MMILHAATLVPQVINQISQPPTVVQCVQRAEPESWLKWLLPTVIQTVVSIASITAGVFIAVKSFRANSEKEHKQWVLDHKKGEWRELLVSFSEVAKEFFPPYTSENVAKAIMENHAAISRRLDGTSTSFIFIAQYLNESSIHLQLHDFMVQLPDDAVLLSKIWYEARGSRKSALESAYLAISNRFYGIVKSTRELAELDLGIAERHESNNRSHDGK